jgi:hypothetical protein
MRNKNILYVLLILIAARAAAPFIVKGAVNRELAKIPNYSGEVRSVSLSFLRGILELNNLQIRDNDNQTSLTIKRAALGVSWLALLRGHLVFNIGIFSPRVRLLVAKPSHLPEQAEKQTAKTEEGARPSRPGSLPDTLSSMLPFRIDRFELTDGTLRLEEAGTDLAGEAEKDLREPAGSSKSEQAEPGFGGRITDFHILAENLTNSRKISGSLTATGLAEARIMDQGIFHLDLKMNPVAQPPDFSTSFSLRNVSLPALNPLFKWQWNIDVKKGTFDLFSEAAAKGGAFDGYVKPLLSNVQMVDLRTERNPGKVAKEATIGSVVMVLKNQPKDRLAGEIPFKGTFENPKIGIWDAIFSMLKNAFVKALEPAFDIKAGVTPSK